MERPRTPKPPSPEELTSWDEFAHKAVEYRKQEKIATVGAAVAITTVVVTFVLVCSFIVIAAARWLLF